MDEPAEPWKSECTPKAAGRTVAITTRYWNWMESRILIVLPSARKALPVKMVRRLETEEVQSSTGQQELWNPPRVWEAPPVWAFLV